MVSSIRHTHYIGGINMKNLFTALKYKYKVVKYARLAGKNRGADATWYYQKYNYYLTKLEEMEKQTI